MKGIKLLVLDVDGTLTDSSIYYCDNNIEIKGFNTKDGAVLASLHHFGIDVVFLTGRASEAVMRRATDLGAVAIQGVSDKAAILRELLCERNIDACQCAYIGDDLNDYAAMNICGFKACPADATSEIKKICNCVSQYNGGQGAVRDICEAILKQNGLYDKFLRLFGAEQNSFELLKRNT